VKKGRHRRFEEARALKQDTRPVDLVELRREPCAECGAAPNAEHASWCMATEELDEGYDEGDDDEADV
jgi:hypothetical protein